MILTLQQKLKNALAQMLSLGRYRQALNRLVLYSGSMGLAQVMMMIYTILLTRIMDPGSYGIFAGTLSLVSLSSFLINWGMDTWMLRAGTDAGRAQALAGTILRTKIYLGLVWGSLLLVFIPLFKPDLFSPVLILVFILDVWCDSSLNTHINAFNLQGKIPAASRLFLFSRAGRLLSAFVILLLGQPSPLAFALARSLATLSSLVMAFGILRPRLHRAVETGGIMLLRQSFHYGFSDLLALIYIQADVSILLLMAGKVATGVYSPASALINALFVIPIAGHMLLIPALARLKDHNLPEFQTVAKQALAGFFLAGVLMVIAIGWSGPYIVRAVLGENYSTSGVLLSLLSPVLGFKSIGAGLAAILVAVNWQQRRLGPQLLSAVTNVLLNLWAIPRWDVYGVAVVYVISEIILTLGYAFWVYQWFRSVRQGTSYDE